MNFEARHHLHLKAVMLRRGTSNRITHRKSTSSIHNPPAKSHIDPEISRQHARAAATYAFAKAQERSSADMGHSGALAGNNSSRQQNENMYSRPNSAADGRGLKRQQSVRFVGPTAAPKRALGTRAIQHNVVRTKLSTGSLRPRAITNDSSVPAAYRPPSRSSSLGKASFSKVESESYATVLAAYDEYYTREDDVASTPSSYRKIRRSKSLLHPGKAPGVLFSNGTPESPHTSRRYNNMWGSKSNQTLRAPKSMSFLQGGRLRSAQNPDYDVAVQEARDKFLHQVEQQRLREQPSFLFRSNRARREERLFRRSVRTTSSTNSYGMPVASGNQALHSGNNGTLRNRARKASQTIRNRLKGVFRRNGDNEVSAIPDQEVKARRSHATDYEIEIGPATTMHDDYLDIPRPDSATVLRVSSRQPSLHAIPSHQQLRSIAGSMQSLRSEASSRSRVTSWTNSETTANSRHVAAERERQRLSIINENGTHKTSSSFPRPPLKNQYSPYPSFHLPGNTHGHPQSPIGPVDSARVYSALMKRLDENSPKAKLTQQKSSMGKFKAPTSNPPRNSSVDSHRSSRGGRTPSIQNVGKSDNELFVSANSSRNTTQSHDDIFTAKSYADSGSVGYKRGRSSSNASTVITRKANYRAYPPPVMGDIPRRMTPQEIAMSNEPHAPITKGLRETRSTFFGASELTNVGRTASPYRRAMVEADLNAVIPGGGLSAGSSPFLPDSLRGQWPITTPVEKTADRHANNRFGTAYSESIYSRTTSGQTPPEAGYVEEVGQDCTPEKHGSALLVDHSTCRYPAPTQRANTSAGSSEWKVWMSAQVSKLERSKENADVAATIPRTAPGAAPSIPKIFGGHVRESAQITGEDTSVAARTVQKANQPLGVVQHNATVMPKPILKNKTSAGSLMVPAFPPVPGQRVPMTMRGSLRQAPSKSSMRSVNTVLTERAVSNSAGNSNAAAAAGHKVLRKQSSMTLRGLDTPNKLVRKSGRRGSNANTPSPGTGLGEVMAAQGRFGSAGGRAPGMENWSPGMEEGCGVEGTGLVGPTTAGVVGRGVDAQVLGSKRMVDMFLSSRRRRVAGSEEDGNAFL